MSRAVPSPASRRLDQLIPWLAGGLIAGAAWLAWQTQPFVDPETTLLPWLIDRGWLLYREGDLKGAAEHLRRAYSGRPDAEIGAHLGEVLWTLGERDEARCVWEESLKSSPDNETLLKTIERFKR